MSKPVAGSQYIVVDGDTLQSIASEAYGDSTRWTLISKANQSELTSNQPVTGQVLIIPILTADDQLRSIQEQAQLGIREVDQLTIIVGGIEIIPKEATITTALDAVSDGFTTVLEWEPGRDPILDAALLPYSFSSASVYIGNKRIINGVIYGIASTLGVESHEKGITGSHRTTDIIDSNLKPPYEQTAITLKDRALELLTPLGINVVYDVDEDESFDRVTAKASDTIFGHLVGLASQRGMLITSNGDGDVVFTRAAESPVVGTLFEGDKRVLSWSGEYDGRARFNAYKANTQSSGFNDITAVSIDDNIPKSRFKTITVSDATNGNIQQAADWRRNKDIADSMAQLLPVSGWFAPDGSLWQKNTLITVKSPTLHVPDGFTFLIRRVQFNYSITKGLSAILDLVPPELYTKERIVEPWQ